MGRLTVNNNRTPIMAPRVSRDHPTGHVGECTDIPGFYGRPVGMLNAPKRIGHFRAFVRFVLVLAAIYMIAKLISQLA